MNLFASLRNAWPRRAHSRRSTTEATARAKWARDHLERKRARERQRRERERRRAEYAQSRARLRGVLAPILFVLALGLGLLLSRPLSELLLMRPAALDRVAVQGARVLSPGEIASRTGLEAGRSLAAIDPEAVREAVAAEPWIASVRALRLPSGTLVIAVVEREAVARWQLDAASDVELVDRRGERFAGRVAPDRPLPLVQGAGDAPLVLSEEALDLLAELERHGTFSSNSAAITLHLPTPAPATQSALASDEAGYVLQIGEEGPRALLGRTGLKERVSRLAALLESEESAISSARWIDLRYADRAVLRAEPVSG